MSGTEHNGATKAERLVQCREMLKARVDGAGKAKAGFKTNVELIRSEIARLEKEIAEGLE